MTSHTAVEVFRRVLPHPDFLAIRHFETVALQNKEYRYGVVSDEAFFLVAMSTAKPWQKVDFMDVVEIEMTEDEAAIADNAIKLRSKKCTLFCRKESLRNTAVKSPRTSASSSPYSPRMNAATSPRSPQQRGIVETRGDMISVSFFTFEEGSILEFCLREAWRTRHSAKALGIPHRWKTISSEKVRKQFQSIEDEICRPSPKQVKFARMEELCIACERYRFVKRLCQESQKVLRYICLELHEFAHSTSDQSLVGLSRLESFDCAVVMVELLHRVLFDSQGIWGLDRGRCFFEEPDDDGDTLFHSLLLAVLNPFVLDTDLQAPPSIDTRGEGKLCQRALELLEMVVAVLFELSKINDESLQTKRIHWSFAKQIDNLVDSCIYMERISDIVFSLMNVLFSPVGPARSCKVLQHASLLFNLISDDDIAAKYLQEQHPEEIKLIFLNPELCSSLTGSIGEMAKTSLEKLVDTIRSKKFQHRECEGPLAHRILRFKLPSVMVNNNNNNNNPLLSSSASFSFWNSTADDSSVHISTPHLLAGSIIVASSSSSSALSSAATPLSSSITGSPQLHFKPMTSTPRLVAPLAAGLRISVDLTESVLARRQVRNLTVRTSDNFPNGVVFPEDDPGRDNHEMSLPVAVEGEVKKHLGNNNFTSNTAEERQSVRFDLETPSAAPPAAFIKMTEDGEAAVASIGRGARRSSADASRRREGSIDEESEEIASDDDYHHNRDNRYKAHSNNRGKGPHHNNNNNNNSSDDEYSDLFARKRFEYEDDIGRALKWNTNNNNNNSDAEDEESRRPRTWQLGDSHNNSAAAVRRSWGSITEDAPTPWRERKQEPQYRGVNNRQESSLAPTPMSANRQQRRLKSKSTFNVSHSLLERMSTFN